MQIVFHTNLLPYTSMPTKVKGKEARSRLRNETRTSSKQRKICESSTKRHCLFQYFNGTFLHPSIQRDAVRLQRHEAQMSHTNKNIY